MKICVLYGGTSRERDVSINTGKSIYESIKHDFEVTQYDYNGNINELFKAVKNVDLVFIALHGGDGEDGRVQKFFERKKIKFTGSNSASSAIAMNKHETKKVCIENNVPTPLWAIVDKSIKDIKIDFKGRAVVKPVNEGSSVGMSIVNRCFDNDKISSDLKNALIKCFNISNSSMIEEYISGRELTVSILNNKCLPIIEILPKGDFYDYKCKYTKGKSDYVVPANLDKNIETLLTEYSIKIHKTIGCGIYSRLDFRLSDDNIIYFLEINTLPGFTDTSLFPKAANSIGLSYNELIKKIIKLA